MDRRAFFRSISKGAVERESAGSGQDAPDLALDSAGFEHLLGDFPLETLREEARNSGYSGSLDDRQAMLAHISLKMRGGATT